MDQNTNHPHELFCFSRNPRTPLVLLVYLIVTLGGNFVVIYHLQRSTASTRVWNIVDWVFYLFLISASLLGAVLMKCLVERVVLLLICSSYVLDILVRFNSSILSKYESIVLDSIIICVAFTIISIFLLRQRFKINH